MFRGILIEKDESGYRAAVKDIDEACLPDGNVTVRVSHSTLNYNYRERAGRTQIPDGPRH